MDEQNKKEDSNQEKKLSRTTLTFYIIGLCSVAIALILISYVLQARNDRQLDNLTTKLSEQQTVAQGATEKMVDLQKQLDIMSAEIEAAKQDLYISEEDKTLADSISRLRGREQVLELLIAAEEAARAGDMEKLADILNSFTDAWSEEQLRTREEGGLFEDADYAVYQSLLMLLAEKNENTAISEEN